MLYVRLLLVFVIMACVKVQWFFCLRLAHTSLFLAFMAIYVRSHTCKLDLIAIFRNKLGLASYPINFEGSR